MEAFEDSNPGPAGNWVIAALGFSFLFYSAWRTRRATEDFARDLRTMNVGQASFQESSHFDNGTLLTSLTSRINRLPHAQKWHPLPGPRHKPLRQTRPRQARLATREPLKELKNSVSPFRSRPWRLSQCIVSFQNLECRHDKSNNCGELFDVGYTRHRTVGRELSLFTFRIIVTIPLDYEDGTNDRDCA